MDRSSIGRLIIVVVVVFGAMLAYAGVGHTQLVLFDNFNGTRIDPEKWRGQEFFSTSTGDNPNAEAVRSIQNRKLRVRLTTYGGTDVNTGRQTGWFGLAVTHPELATAMEATVTIKDAVVQDCAANSSHTIARAQLGGWFFNDGTSTGAGDWTGDFRATIQKHRSSRSGDLILAAIARCANPECRAETNVKEVVLNTTWELDKADRLRIVWDPAHDRFLFKVITSTGVVESKALSYAGLSDADPPQGKGYKRLIVVNSAPNCTVGRKEASLEAFFDNVRLNPEAIP